MAAVEATTAVGTAVAAVEASADVGTAVAAVEAAGVDVEAASVARFVAACVANSPDKSKAPSFGWTNSFPMKGSPEWNVASRVLSTQLRGSSSAAVQSFLQTGHVNFLLWSHHFLMQ